MRERFAPNTDAHTEVTEQCSFLAGPAAEDVEFLGGQLQLALGSLVGPASGDDLQPVHEQIELEGTAVDVLFRLAPEQLLVGHDGRSNHAQLGEMDPATSHAEQRSPGQARPSVGHSQIQRARPVRSASQMQVGKLDAELEQANA